MVRRALFFPELVTAPYGNLLAWHRFLHRAALAFLKCFPCLAHRFSPFPQSFSSITLQDSVFLKKVLPFSKGGASPDGLRCISLCLRSVSEAQEHRSRSCVCVWGQIWGGGDSLGGVLALTRWKIMLSKEDKKRLCDTTTLNKQKGGLKALSKEEGEKKLEACLRLFYFPQVCSFSCCSLSAPLVIEASVCRCRLCDALQRWGFVVLSPPLPPFPFCHGAVVKGNVDAVFSAATFPIAVC